MMKLAQIYTVGDGVPTNAPEGEKWFIKAAQLGNSNAATALGDLFMQRHESNIIDPATGLPSPSSDDDPDLKQATNWYHKAAEAGDPYGQIKLSQYYKGEAPPINPNTGLPVTNLTNEAEAFKWYDKAFQTLTDRAKKGDQTAQATLARWQFDAPNSWIDAKKPWTNAVHVVPPTRLIYKDDVP